MRSYAHLNTAVAIIRSYDGRVPLASWLKDFFRQHKKYGSSDRRQISHICYSYFRASHILEKGTEEEDLLKALFLCTTAGNRILEELKPEWNSKVQLPLEEKIRMLSLEHKILSLFPFHQELSPEIDHVSLCLSMLIQPDLFLRIRPGRENKVNQILQKSGLIYDTKGHTVRLTNATKVEEMFTIDEDVVIQDVNSQHVLDTLADLGDHFRTMWDCCAASGGKSILFHDLFPAVPIHVTDVRSSILINLEKRFRRAGVNRFHKSVKDLSVKDFSCDRSFDLVICDAPCSGSGTWSRTPEQLAFFKNEKIDYYADLQKKIVSNAARCLGRNGYFLYITCSVFKKENEEIVNLIQEQLQLQLKSMQYFKGYSERADTLFCALFVKQDLGN